MIKYLLCVLLIPCLIWAQPQHSANFRITKSVLDAGGARSGSAAFRLTSAFGQPTPVGVQSSAGFRLYSGFLVPALAVSPLSPIQDLVISFWSPDARLDWTARPGALSYKIYRATNPLFTPAPSTLIGTSTDPNFTDPDILSQSGAQYFYTVTVSSEASAVQTGTTLPKAALNPHAKVNPDRLGIDPNGPSARAKEGIK